MLLPRLFAGRAIYSIGNLYSGYDQSQLAINSREITTIRTPIGLMQMHTLPQGATNSMMNAMNKVLRNFGSRPRLADINGIRTQHNNKKRKSRREQEYKK